MSGVTRISVSLDNINTFSEENVRNIAEDGQAMAILNEWFDPLFARQSLDESHPAGRRRATVNERFNTLYIYHSQGNTAGFVGFYDYYRGKLTPQEKTSFDQLGEADKEIRLRAAVYAAAASIEPVLAMQTGTKGGRPTMEVMYPKAVSTAEIPPEAFGLFARFLRTVLPKSMYPDSIKTEQERAISTAEDVYDSKKGDVAAATEALTNRVAAETEEMKREAATREAQAPQAQALMIAESQRRQLLGIDENAKHNGAREEFLFKEDFVAKRDVRLDDSYYAKKMHGIHRVKEDFPSLEFEDIKFESLDYSTGARVRRTTERNTMEFNIRHNVRGFVEDPSDYGLHTRTNGRELVTRYAHNTTPTHYHGTHEAGHAVSFNTTGLMWGKQPNKKLNDYMVEGPMNQDLSNRKSEQNFAREAILRAYDADKNFRDAMDGRVTEWEKSNRDIRINANSTDSQKRARAVQFISDKMVSEAPKLTTMDDRTDIYAEIYRMGYTSKYGSTNASEFMAEAFADHYYIKDMNKTLKDGQKLRENPLSKQVVELTKELNKSPLARLRFAEKYPAPGYDMNVLRVYARPELEAEAAKQEAAQQKQQNPQAQATGGSSELKVSQAGKGKGDGQGNTPPKKGP